MTAWATFEDLANFIGQEIPLPAAREDGAEMLLDMVAEAVRGYCHQTIDKVPDDELTLTGRDSALLLIPELPVTEIAINLDGADDDLVSGTDYTLLPGGLLYRGVIPASVGPMGSFASSWFASDVWPATSTIVITYTHGYDPIPVDLKLVYLRAVARLFTNPGGLVSESIAGAYSTTSASAGASLFTAEERGVLDRYRIER